MSCKTINLVVVSSKTPYTLTISDCNRNLIAKRTVLSQTASFCLTTNLCCIRILGTFDNQTIVKTVNLSNCKCQRITASFGFSSPQPVLQTFALTDENYGLPVENAVLNFQQV